jgi:hypothetical protein
LIQKPKYIGLDDFTIRVRYLLENGLHQLSIIRIKLYDSSGDKGPIPYFRKDFIPYVSSNNIDKIAEDILEEYYPEMLQAPMALPIYDFARNIGGEVEERTLPQ